MIKTANRAELVILNLNALDKKSSVMEIFIFYLNFNKPLICGFFLCNFIARKIKFKIYNWYYAKHPYFFLPLPK